MPTLGQVGGALDLPQRDGAVGHDRADSPEPPGEEHFDQLVKAIATYDHTRTHNYRP